MHDPVAVRFRETGCNLSCDPHDPTALEPLRKALEGKRGRSRVTLVVPMPDDSEAEVTLPGSYSIAAGLRDTIGGLPGIAQVEEI